jgi:hypothetical protein
MSRQCITCGTEIDPRRIAILPHTQTCTQHSIAEKKVAVTVQMGEGDHTWIETYAVDRADYDKMVELETGKKTKPDPIKTVLDDTAFIDEWDETLNDGLDDDDDDDDDGWEDVDDLLEKDSYTEDED